MKNYTLTSILIIIVILIALSISQIITGYQNENQAKQTAIQLLQNLSMLLIDRLDISDKGELDITPLNFYKNNILSSGEYTQTQWLLYPNAMPAYLFEPIKNINWRLRKSNSNKTIWQSIGNAINCPDIKTDNNNEESEILSSKTLEDGYWCHVKVNSLSGAASTTIKQFKDVDGILYYIFSIKFQISKDKYNTIDMALPYYELNKKNWVNIGQMTFNRTHFLTTTSIFSILFIGLAFVLYYKTTVQPANHLIKQMQNITSGKARRLSIDENSEDKFKELSKHFNVLIEKEKITIARLKVSTNNISHSLKMPISAIANLLEQEEINSKDIKPYIEKIKNTINYHLKKIRIKNTSSIKQNTDIYSLAKDSLIMISKSRKIEQQGCLNFQVNIDSDLSYPIDSGDLYEILGNLLKNAVQYADKKALLTVKIIVSKQRKKQLLIEVEDDGPGVSQAVIDGILNLDKILLEGEGTVDYTPQNHGIGLVTVNMIAQEYGGQFEIERSPSLGGALFRIIIQ